MRSQFRSNAYSQRNQLLQEKQQRQEMSKIKAERHVEWDRLHRIWEEADNRRLRKQREETELRAAKEKQRLEALERRRIEREEDNRRFKEALRAQRQMRKISRGSMGSSLHSGLNDTGGSTVSVEEEEEEGEKGHYMQNIRVMPGYLVEKSVQDAFSPQSPSPTAGILAEQDHAPVLMSALKGDPPAEFRYTSRIPLPEHPAMPFPTRLSPLFPAASAPAALSSHPTTIYLPYPAPPQSQPQTSLPGHVHGRLLPPLNATPTAMSSPANSGTTVERDGADVKYSSPFPDAGMNSKRPSIAPLGQNREIAYQSYSPAAAAMHKAGDEQAKKMDSGNMRAGVKSKGTPVLVKVKRSQIEELPLRNEREIRSIARNGEVQARGEREGHDMDTRLASQKPLMRPSPFKEGTAIPLSAPALGANKEQSQVDSRHEKRAAGSSVKQQSRPSGASSIPTPTRTYTKVRKKLGMPEEHSTVEVSRIQSPAPLTAPSAPVAAAIGAAGGDPVTKGGPKGRSNFSESNAKEKTRRRRPDANPGHSVVRQREVEEDDDDGGGSRDGVHAMPRPNTADIFHHSSHLLPEDSQDEFLYLEALSRRPNITSEQMEAVLRDRGEALLQSDVVGQSVVLSVEEQRLRESLTRLVEECERHKANVGRLHEEIATIQSRASTPLRSTRSLTPYTPLQGNDGELRLQHTGSEEIIKNANVSPAGWSPSVASPPRLATDKSTSSPVRPGSPSIYSTALNHIRLSVPICSPSPAASAGLPSARSENVACTTSDGGNEFDGDPGTNGANSSTTSVQPPASQGRIIRTSKANILFE